jgi:large subunit ribosomal protein L7/L12
MAGFFDLFRDPEPTELDRAGYEEVLGLIRADRRIQGVKVIRERTGMGLVEAKERADAIDEGRWAPVPTSLSLADRVRELLDQGRSADAVHMVTEETGMTEDEASRFVGSVDRRE